MGSVSGMLADSARSYLKDRLYIILKGYLLWYWAARVRRARRAGVSWFMEWLSSLYCTNIRTHIRTHIHSSTHTQKHTSHIASSWLQVPLGDFHPQTHTQTHTRQEGLDQGCQTPGPRIVPAKTSNWRASVNVKEGTHFQHLTVFS